MNEVPEGAGTRPECGRADGHTPGNLLWQAGSVCVPSSAVVKGVTALNDRRPILYASNAQALLSDEKARRPEAARNLEVGGATARAVGERGSRWWVWVDGMRPEATGRRPRTWGGAGRLSR